MSSPTSKPGLREVGPMVREQIASEVDARQLARRLDRVDRPGAKEAASVLRQNWRVVAAHPALMAEMFDLVRRGEK